MRRRRGEGCDHVLGPTHSLLSERESCVIMHRFNHRLKGGVQSLFCLHIGSICIRSSTLITWDKKNWWHQPYAKRFQTKKIVNLKIFIQIKLQLHYYLCYDKIFKTRPHLLCLQDIFKKTIFCNIKSLVSTSGNNILTTRTNNYIYE